MNILKFLITHYLFFHCISRFYIRIIITILCIKKGL